MNREIKFRVWNESGKNMLFDIDNVFECLKQQLKNDESMSDRGFITPYDHYSEGMRWMQYTGLKDKNGVEIYEGDIVKNKKIKGDVKWNNYSFVVYDKNDDYMLLGLASFWEFEVIGNIYETKKALE